MNQILSTENYSTQNRIQDNAPRIPHESPRRDKNNTHELLDMRKIIIVFSVLAIIFALIIIGVKVIGLIKNNSKKKPTPIEVLNEPEITMEKADDICVLKVFYDDGIDKVAFWWNENDVKELSLNGLNDWFVQNITIPEGDKNTLHVKVTTSNDKVKEVSKSFTEMTGVIESENKPEITWDYNKQTKEITLTAKSDIGLVDLSYHWKGEELQTIKNDKDNQTELKAILQVKMGPNWLYATATDTEGNTAILDHDNYIVVVLDPEIGVSIIEQEDGRAELKVKIHHDSGFEKVVIKFNELEAVYDKNSPGYDPTAKDLEVSQTYEPDAVVHIECSVYTRESPEMPFEQSGDIDLAR